MRASLVKHPQSHCAAVSSVNVDVDRLSLTSLMLRFAASGAIGDIAIPPPAPPGRRDGLWRRTCFEAFFRGKGEDSYCEFNFSPSTEWAAYRFARYREGMAELENVERIAVERGVEPGCLVVAARLDLARMGQAADEGLLCALSAIIEEKSGSKSYWALAHPAGKPDFHHIDCFKLEIARNTAS
ncbi:MAG: DOMON-like domain-containing protein [Parvularculaceae bacterium]|nr:DOMON-like domain-containing protein [Parvularculaceae bacterium]